MLHAVLSAATEGGETHSPVIPEWYDIIWSSVCFVIILHLLLEVRAPARAEAAR